jgi:hypothetical protein
MSVDRRLIEIAQMIANCEALEIYCPHDTRKLVLVSKNGKTLIYCSHLVNFLASGRKIISGCSLLSKKCPFESRGGISIT